MAEASPVVLVGWVCTVTSLGRPDLAEDPYADEFVAVTIEVEEVLKGDPVDSVTLGWDAVHVDPDGRRVARLLANGLRPPVVNDRMLLFLEPVDPGFAEFVGGALTHQDVKLDGVGYLRGERVVDGEHNGGAGELLQTMTLDEVHELLRHY